jgi:hypothetical protein
MLGAPLARLVASDLGLSALVAATAAPAAQSRAAAPLPLAEALDGRGESPQPRHPNNRDLTVHSRGREPFCQSEAMAAGHSEHFGSLLGVHHVCSYAAAVVHIERPCRDRHQGWRLRRQLAHAEPARQPRR